MGTGIRAEIRVDPDGTCPIVEASSGLGSPSYTIARSVTGSTAERVNEEFILESGGDPEASVELTEVFDYGAKRMYRFSRERGRGCPCEIVEVFDCPIVDLHSRDDSLYLVFHAADMDTLQETIVSLQDRFSEVDVRRLLRSEHDAPEANLVLLDRSRLTDRQREVLETASSMGYFEHPKGANAGEVADELGITTSTFSEHLSAAQSKLMDAILDV
ncbi:MAG: helix-turn-helix domain-containing protein [Halobacteriota archaeon]|uniref:helix-turn-helix domain-containing protein n=1 Tax=Natronomonas sp. TaxID=2184060 RepID=UPI0039762A58